MSISISDFVPREYQRSAEREQLFRRSYRRETGEYDVTAEAAIEYLCTKRYRNRPEIGYLPKRQTLHVKLYPLLVYFSDPAHSDPAQNEGQQISDEVVRTFSKVVKDPQIKLVVIRLNRYIFDDGHALALVIDKVAKRVEFYDPNGSVALDDRDGQYMIRAVMTFLKRDGGLGDEYQPMEWAQTCSKYGVQMMEGLFPKERGELEGYCVIWSLFLMELRIRHPRQIPAEAQLEFIQVMMRRVLPTITLRKGEGEALLTALIYMVHDPTKMTPELHQTLIRYFPTQREAMTAGRKIANVFREFIKNYFGYLHKLMKATPRSKSRSPAYGRSIRPLYRGAQVASIRYSLRLAQGRSRVTSRSRSRVPKKRKSRLPPNRA